MDNWFLGPHIRYRSFFEESGGPKNKKIMPQLEFYFLSRGLKCWVGRKPYVKTTYGNFNELLSSSISQIVQNKTSLLAYLLILQREGMSRQFWELFTRNPCEKLQMWTTTVGPLVPKIWSESDGNKKIKGKQWFFLWSGLKTCYRRKNRTKESIFPGLRRVLKKYFYLG